MRADYGALAVRFGELLGLAQGMNLKLAHLTKQGMELVFEDGVTRTEVRLLPQVYVEGKVIVDAINDLTMVLDVRQFDVKTGKEVGGGKTELPYSTWFFEGDYL
jgi:hypothetical protein